MFFFSRTLSCASLIFVQDFTRGLMIFYCTPAARSNFSAIFWLFKICWAKALKMCVKKSTFLALTVKQWGQFLDKNSLRIDSGNAKGLRNLSAPTTAAELSQFADCLQWMSQAIPRIAESVLLLHNLVEKSYKVLVDVPQVSSIDASFRMLSGRTNISRDSTHWKKYSFKSSHLHSRIQQILFASILTHRISSEQECWTFVTTTYYMSRNKSSHTIQLCSFAAHLMVQSWSVSCTRKNLTPCTRRYAISIRLS